MFLCLTRSARIAGLDAPMLRKRARTTRRIATIDMTGFAAVMLALVALFAFPGAIPNRYRLPWSASNISPDLVQVNHPVEMRGAIKEDALFMAITRDGSIFFDQGKVKDSALLPSKIRERLDQGAERKVYLKVDARARYGAVRDALGIISAAGVENVAFLVIERAPRRPLP